MAANFIQLTQKTYPEQLAHFEQIIADDHLSHLYLLAGNKHHTKLAFARSLAWLVAGPTERNAHRIEQNDHPDIFTVTPETGSDVLKVGQIRALMPEFMTTGLESSRKIFIIDQVQTMTISAANSLLKFIEEPAGPQLILLLTDSVAEVLPTIRSRAQVVHLTTFDGGEFGNQTTGLDDGWVGEAQPILFKWFEKAMQRDLSAFSLVQTQLVPLAADKQQQNLLLEWLHQLTRDMIVFNQVDDQRLFFPQLRGFYTSLHRQYTLEQLMAAGDGVLADDDLRKINLSWQSRLEKITLDLSLELGVNDASTKKF
ncbi:DNA polymerase III subunit delta [Convivina praedatoris]|uniref:DNA polymerase III subunit delta n=1 Tax=Convivina praedatoris TaxID=2880963 RepID=A0ABN8HBW6_9LACO|nr:DNA polymerase III subunit delta [Convivina sp. LMG 32447]CAH1851662.1 hypothetical protein LMG032447_00372 [Convivina sp. LMG 32447]CAH1853157.1 hypothetical protein R077815_00735 [Convivina sp. LMG 32447]